MEADQGESESGESQKSPALRKRLWVNPCGIHRTGPALRIAAPMWSGRIGDVGVKAMRGSGGFFRGGF
jgi:hypothetical protein